MGVRLRAKFYLVGAGPGDPELLTRKAHRLLQQADVVIYDRLVSEEILALANPFAQIIYAGKSKGEQDQVQGEIYDLFLRFSGQARVVVRLKSGDPTVFGRSGEELAFLLEHGLEAEIVPGVSSALAAPALAGIPLTLRNVARSFAVLAGHRESVEGTSWAAYKDVDTLVVLMGVENRASIARCLIDAGRSPMQAAAFIERASTAEERVLVSTLFDIANGAVEVESPAVFIIGEVVRFRSCAAEARAAESIAC
jgi:uroporphyrin-III C-methyltransferase